MASGRIDTFIKKLALTKTNNGVFNPYNQLIKEVDERTAPGLRQQNLRIYLNSHYENKSKMLWVYLMPSFSEAKRSGVPLMNGTNLKQVEGALSAEQHFEKTTKSRSKTENSLLATIVREVMDDLNINPLLWPTIPFYTFGDDAMENERKPSLEEIEKYKWFLFKIIDIYKPKKIIAIGKDTEEILNHFVIEAATVTHPLASKSKFKREITKLIS